MAFNVSGKCPNCGEPIHVTIFAEYEDEGIYINHLEDTNIILDEEAGEFRCPKCGRVLYIVADIQWGLLTDSDDGYEVLDY